MFLMFLCLKNSGRRGLMFLMSKNNSGSRDNELLSNNSGRRGRKWTYVLMSKKKDGGSYGKYV